jgi:predicted kinase
MSRLIIICGLPGSGKTTLAKRLEAELQAVRFCPDEWMQRLAISLYDEGLRGKIEAAQWRLVQELLRRGLCAVIEWGTWARSERDMLRLGAMALGSEVELRYLSAPGKVLFERIERRGMEQPPVTREQVDAWESSFQAPGSEELALYGRPQEGPQAARGEAGQVFLLCGLTGSGKTRWAEARQSQGAVRLSTDEWMISFFGQHMPRQDFDRRMEACLALQMDLAADMALRGLDVVLDHGFWRRDGREGARNFFKKRGVATQGYYFTAGMEVLKARLKERNKRLPPSTFEISEEMLEEFAGRFEAPAPDELFTEAPC